MVAALASYSKPLQESKWNMPCIGFKATNNEAEYETLLAELRVVRELEVESLKAYSDSQLVVNHVQMITSLKISICWYIWMR